MNVFQLVTLFLLTIAVWAFAAFLGGHLGTTSLIVLTLLCWLFAAAWTVAAENVRFGVWIAAGLLTLVALALPASTVLTLFPLQLTQPFSLLVGLTLVLIPAMALIISAVLLYSSVRLYKVWRNTGKGPHAGWAAGAGVVLSVLLLGKTLHFLYWLIIWDTTYDPLGNFWLGIPILAVLTATVVLVNLLPGRLKVAAGLYVILTPTMLLAVSARAQNVDFRQLTEARAERIDQAIERYYTREGHYPHDLQQLTPLYALSVPKPVIIFGQDWCYDGGDNYYRLGYVYREHWSDPRLTGRLYTTKGESSDPHTICEEKISELLTRYSFFVRMDE